MPEAQDVERREREMKATLDQIKAFNKNRKTKWRLEDPVWRIALEGICLFLLGGLVGMGMAVLYKIIAE